MRRQSNRNAHYFCCAVLDHLTNVQICCATIVVDANADVSSNDHRRSKLHCDQRRPSTTNNGYSRFVFPAVLSSRSFELWNSPSSDLAPTTSNFRVDCECPSFLMGDLNWLFCCLPNEGRFTVQKDEGWWGLGSVNLNWFDKTNIFLR